ncbi:PD40 domain-containing protein [Amycolatopsis rubida]|uniref:WD40-like Beta Propeller Repeat n=1 Tax=Amycolatopsis rubida TaxID=112413 RepID=A0A1I5WQK4_9PSEU|nr:PD40 domain-containing protein [Amycolatopsis rubida]SFQ21798.1 WD40-like Beta Propeller Repeat [Amycolatopsis rubida]
MTAVQAIARIPTASIGKLVCHPKLPLVAGIDQDRPAVRLYYAERVLREFGAVGADSAQYGKFDRWPVVAWHPERPELVVSGGGETVRWTRNGTSVLDIAVSDDVAFSPDGQSLWTSPTPPGLCDRSDVIDLGTGIVEFAPVWDTGIVAHPAGGLIATKQSDQGATFVLFSRPGDRLRFRDRALILDGGGYGLPVFSPDGRHLAIRGDDPGHLVLVFEFPSLRRVRKTTFSVPEPDSIDDMNWVAEYRSWAWHNIAFGTRPGALWIGTPSGTVLELDVERGRTTEHKLLRSAVTALAATSSGDLVVAGDGELALVPVPGPRTVADPATVAEFLASTAEIPGDGLPEDHVVHTDGISTWGQEDLATITEAAPGDPHWLQTRAWLNARRS